MTRSPSCSCGVTSDPGTRNLMFLRILRARRSWIISILFTTVPFQVPRLAATVVAAISGSSVAAEEKTKDGGERSGGERAETAAATGTEASANTCGRRRRPERGAGVVVAEA